MVLPNTRVMKTIKFKKITRDSKRFFIFLDELALGVLISTF
ncbi:hypothetical protein LEP1GSC041_3740 [Leptospira noguchii str. 2006001870]|nr:hypothetical protein LEP1GSC041_3740 [Leptospira noguchii str. 2006001870]